eukprot:symbB.v1.2.000934.t2/scaffold54.1/size375170/7
MAALSPAFVEALRLGAASLQRPPPTGVPRTTHSGVGTLSGLKSSSSREGWKISMAFSLGLLAARGRTTMYAKAKTKGKKGKATATANALKALQALETANVKEQEEKQKKKRKNGREGKADARANALKALQEIEGTPEVTEEKPKEEAKVQEEKPKEEAKVAEEKVKEEAKVQEEETPKEEMKVQEEEKPKEEMKVQEEEKPKEEMKVQEEEKPKEEMKVQEEETPKEEMKTPGFADVLKSTNWDAATSAAPATNVYQPGSDPFGEIQEIHEDMHRRRGGTNKKNMDDDDDDELDRADYYARKGIQDPAREWASMQEPLEEEDDEEEEVLPIKRRRGTDDQVDFSFLERGDVEGEVTVGIKEVAIRLGGRTVLQDASWTVKTGERLALVGANGCGKTTQLRILLGQLQADSGQVVRSPAGAKIAILEQSFVDDLNLENTLREELLAAVPQQKAIMEEKAKVEARLEENPEDPDEVQRLVERFNELQVQGEEFQVEKLDDILRSVSEVAGFDEEDLDRKVGLFSGGWKVRLGVCKIFMMRPDVLLLDEPTNHLDLGSVEWIENYMRGQDLPMVVVTHDREFMNRVCNRVVETVEGMTYSYEGNYTEFVKQKQAKMEKWRKNYDLQEKKKKQLEDYIKENKGNQSLAQARKQRAKELEELKETGLDPPPAFIKRIKFRFPEPPKERRGGAQTEILAELRRVSHGYGTKDDEEYELLKDVDFMVTPGDKIGIVGGNGKGKIPRVSYFFLPNQSSSIGKLRGGAPSHGKMVFRASTASFTSLQSYVEPELLRGVPLHTCLSGWGKHWQQSESAMCSTDDSYDLGEQIEQYDVFLSHDWATSRWLKLCSMMIIFNSHAAFWSSFIVSVITGFLRAFEVIPDQMWTISSGYVVYLLVLCFWQRLRRVFFRPLIVFVDKLCIAQHDEELKEKGILALAGFLDHSRKLTVLWSPRYFQRLWCAYELAAYSRAEEKPLQVMPVKMSMILGLTSICWHFLCVTFHLIAWTETSSDPVFSQRLTASFFTMLLLCTLMPGVCYVGIQLMDDLTQLPQQLKSFRIQESKCFCCTSNHVHPVTGRGMICDRSLVFHTLKKWFGSRADADHEGSHLELFNQMIQQELSQSILQTVGWDTAPLTYCIYMVSAGNVPFIAQYIARTDSWGKCCGASWRILHVESWRCFCQAVYVVGHYFPPQHLRCSRQYRFLEIRPSHYPQTCEQQRVWISCDDISIDLTGHCLHTLLVMVAVSSGLCLDVQP